MDVLPDRQEALLDVYQLDPVKFIDDLVELNENGRPFKLQPHQREILRMAFQREDLDRLRYNTIVYSAPKKSGKTLINALGVIWWAYTQESPNEILIVANDLEQAQGRVFRDVCGLIQRNPMLTVGISTAGAGIFAREIRLSSGTLIRTLSSDYAGEAGANHGMTSWDELWGYASERSMRMWEELTPVPTRKNSIRFVTTYAGYEGESKLLLDLYRNGVGADEHPAGRAERAHPTLPVWRNRRAKLFTYWDHEPRMKWQTPEYYAEQREILRPMGFVRLHENRWTSGESVFIAPTLWDPCVEPTASPSLRGNAPIYVGVDAARKHDTAAVVAVRWLGARLELVSHRIWQPTPKDPLDIEATIGEFIRELAISHPIGLVYVDPWNMATVVTALKAEGVPIYEYPQTTGNTTAMGQALWEVLLGRNISLYPAEDMRVQAMNTVGVETPRGWRIAKEKASRKIDSIVALAMAVIAALDTRAMPSAAGSTEHVSVMSRARQPSGWLGTITDTSRHRIAVRESKFRYPWEK